MTLFLTIIVAFCSHPSPFWGGLIAKSAFVIVLSWFPISLPSMAEKASGRAPRVGSLFLLNPLRVLLFVRGLVCICL